MTDTTTTVDTYLAAYSEPERGRRDALIARAWADDARLVDPPVEGQGHAAISDMADALPARGGA